MVITQGLQKERRRARTWELSAPSLLIPPAKLPKRPSAAAYFENLSRANEQSTRALHRLWSHAERPVGPGQHITSLLITLFLS